MIEALRLAAAAGGAALVLAVLIDVSRTALGGRGAGPIIGAVSAGLWRAALFGHRRRSSHRGLAAAGVVILLAGFAVWSLLLWAGWTLIFTGDVQAVLHSKDQVPASWWQRAYYAGFSMSTLGVGDFVAGGALWQMLTVVAALTGFSVLTLSVTYLLGLLPALSRKRAVANYITALGGTPVGIIGAHFKNGSGESLVQHVSTLMMTLENVAQEHAAYPLLHYFHATDRASSLPLRLSALAESFLFLDAGVVGDRRVVQQLTPLRHSIDSMLVTLGELYISTAESQPPPPDTASLPESLQPGDSPEMLRLAEQHGPERRRLLGYVQNDGWAWQDVYVDPRNG